MTLHRMVDGQMVPLTEDEVTHVVQEWSVNAVKLGTVLDAAEAVLIPVVLPVEIAVGDAQVV